MPHPGVAQNGTAGFPQQLSLFYAGKIAPNFGAFFQLTYANDSGTIGIDNTDLRFADTTLLPDKQPAHLRRVTQQQPDRAGSVELHPRWGFPYAASSATVSPLAGTAIDGAFAQDVAGLTAYAVLERVAVRRGRAATARPSRARPTQLTGGAGPLDGTASNVMSGLAPYWRVAYEHNWDRHSIEAGAVRRRIQAVPGRQAGRRPLRGPFNRFNDVAEDVQYQFVGDEHLVTVAGNPHPRVDDAGCELCGGASANPSNDLTTTRVWATYYYRRRIGGTLGYFSTTGSYRSGTVSAPGSAPGSPGVVTSANGSPDTRGWMAEVNYLPWLNVKISAQYTEYNKFNGGGQQLRRGRTQCLRQQHAVPAAVVCILRCRHAHHQRRSDDSHLRATGRAATLDCRRGDALALACGEARADEPDAATEAYAQKVAITVCGTCHGPTGNSTQPKFPRLAGQNAQLPRGPAQGVPRADARRSGCHRLHVGHGGSARRRHDRCARGLLRRAEGGAQRQPATRALVDARNEIYEHGIPARGRARVQRLPRAGRARLQEFPRLAGQHAQYVLKQLASFQSNMRNVAIMHGVAQNLRLPEMQAVAAYLEAQP